MKFLALALLAALTVAAKPRPTPGPKLQILGHAGSGFFTPISPFNFRPPSSWMGVHHALAQGTDGIEIDLQLTQDSVLVLYHDPRLENSSTGHGCISQHTAAEVTALRYHGGFPYDLFQKEHPITFDTLLARLSRRPRFPMLHLDFHEADECQPAGHQLDRAPAYVRQLARSLARYHVPPQNVLLTITEFSTVRLAQAALPQVPIGLELNVTDLTPGIRFAQAEKLRAVVLDADRATLAQTQQAHAAGLAVVIYGGRSRKNLRHILATQPDEMEVDNLELLLKMQGRKQLSVISE